MSELDTPKPSSEILKASALVALIGPIVIIFIGLRDDFGRLALPLAAGVIGGVVTAAAAEW